MPLLIEVFQRLDELSDNDVVYAVRPWTPGSVAYIETIDPENYDGRFSEELIALGAEYFLEAMIAREFLQGWFGEGRVSGSLEALERLIVYADTDA